VEAFSQLAQSSQQKTVIVPADMAGITGSIAGIAELVKSAIQDGPSGGAPPRRTPSVPPPAGA